MQVFVTLPVQHGATVEQKLRSLIVEVFHRLPTSEVQMTMPALNDRMRACISQPSARRTCLSHYSPHRLGFLHQRAVLWHKTQYMPWQRCNRVGEMLIASSTAAVSGAVSTVVGSAELSICKLSDCHQRRRCGRTCRRYCRRCSRPRRRTTRRSRCCACGSFSTCTRTSGRRQTSRSRTCASLCIR